MKYKVKKIIHKAFLSSPLAKEDALDQLGRLVWEARFEKWKATHEKAPVHTRPEIYQQVVDKTLEGDIINYLEFGVFEGKSMRWWVANNSFPESRFYGFDTFTGLPEKWEGYEAGHFDTRGVAPNISDERTHFIKGLFQDTLPEFLRAFDDDKRKVIHIDCDLYSSSVYVLFQLQPLIRPGDIILFDELFFSFHEFRAWENLLEACPMDYELIAHSDGSCLAAILIK